MQSANSLAEGFVMHVIMSIAYVSHIIVQTNNTYTLKENTPYKLPTQQKSHTN